MLYLAIPFLCLFIAVLPILLLPCCVEPDHPHKHRRRHKHHTHTESSDSDSDSDGSERGGRHKRRHKKRRSGSRSRPKTKGRRSRRHRNRDNHSDRQAHAKHRTKAPSNMPTALDDITPPRRGRHSNNNDKPETNHSDKSKVAIGRVSPGHEHLSTAPVAAPAAARKPSGQKKTVESEVIQPRRRDDIASKNKIAKIKRGEHAVNKVDYRTFNNVDDTLNETEYNTAAQEAKSQLQNNDQINSDSKKTTSGSSPLDKPAKAEQQPDSKTGLLSQAPLKHHSTDNAPKQHTQHTNTLDANQKSEGKSSLIMI